MRVGRTETLDGLPILGVGAPDVSRRPHPLWNTLVHGLPDKVQVVFAPQFRTGWRPDGKSEVLGAWVVLREGSMPAPGWLRAGGLTSGGGAVRGWMPFWVATVPSEWMANEEPGRPFLLHQAQEVRKAMRVMRDGLAWRKEDIGRVRAMHLNASRAAKRRAIDRDRADNIDAMRFDVVRAAKMMRDQHGSPVVKDTALQHKLMDAQAREQEAADEFHIAPSERTRMAYDAAVSVATHIERRLKNA